MLRRATIDALKQLGILIEMLMQQPNGAGEHLFREARIGAHIRHVHDHFKAVLNGLETGTVDYNKRNRESVAETNITLSKVEHQTLLAQMSNAVLAHPGLFIISEIDCFISENTELPSSIEREMLYLINHTIHHVAIIKQILQHHGIETPGYLGVAPSTASHQRQLAEPSSLCAQ
jgi:hypothetical protein